MFCISAFASTPPSPVTSQPAGFIAVFDFACPADPQIGRDLARRVRGRLGRAITGSEVIDHLSMQELTSTLKPRLDTPDQRMAEWMTERVGATAAMWGELSIAGPTHTLTVRYADVSGIRWRKVFTDATQRAGGLLARQVVEAVTGVAAWVPPQYGDEAEPDELGRPLNRNGTFDAEGFHPVGWQPVDGISTLIVHHPDRGRVLRVNTRLERVAWLAWQHALRRGEGNPQRPPKIGPSPLRYGDVAGTEGVMLVSDWIDATPGRRYWLTADVRAPAKGQPEPKIFIKGYADFAAGADSLSEVALRKLGLTPEQFAALPEPRRKKLIAADARTHPQRHRREVYRWYLACRDAAGAFRHCAAPFPPRGGLPANVKYLRIQIYAYWPPGEYLFDNVHLYADPRQSTTAPAAKPRTPGPKVVSEK